MEFSGAAEGLGYNEAALKDLFNSALDEPLSWWRMRGQNHLTFEEFVEFFARSPTKVAGVPQVVGDKAAAPPVTADEAAVSLVAADEAAVLTEDPRIWSATPRTSRSFVGYTWLRRSVEDPPLMLV